MKKDTKIYLWLVLIVAVIVIAIILLKANKGDLTKQELLCLAEKSELYVSSTCGHCKDQEDMLLKNLEKYDLNLSVFNITMCNNEENIQKCQGKGITGVPTWIINNTQYKGVKELKTLKNMTKC